jgi:hypothetical protein
MSEVQSLLYFGLNGFDLQKFDSKDERERSVEPSERNS